MACMLRYPLLLAVVAGLTFAAVDPGGWTAAKWGMTEEQVLKAAPSVKVLDLPLMERTFTPGGVARIGVPTLRLESTAWHVFCLFDEKGGLAAVEMRPVADSDGTPNEFERVKALLVQKYGQPLEQRVDDDNPRTHTATWTFATTTIRLKYVDVVTIKLHFLSLAYDRRSAAAEDKL
jgi:hypothetical protein